ncbi:MAG TPA: outer membrane beta-barrel protein [Tepidisphaeraceae bacterium]
MPSARRNIFASLSVFLALGAAFPPACAQDAAPLPTLNSLIPQDLRQDLDAHFWGWASYLATTNEDDHSYWDGELSLDVTKTYANRVAATVQMNFIDANDQMRGELEQAFVSVLLSEQGGTIFTAGKFNANFGVEARDFWNRYTGTTSLLFAAQPQDLIGLMLTQPVGDTGLKVRGFLTNGFQGRFDFDQVPSGGITIEYRPHHDLRLALTNWVGPGFVKPYEEDEEEQEEEYEYGTYAEYGSSEYGEYGEYAYGRPAFANWQGPRFDAETGGTLYFLDAKAIWTPRADLTLAAEYLLGITSSSEGQFTWTGFMLLANYDITDRWRVFGRWSYLDDTDGVVTGTAQRLHELSAGLAYTLVRNVELRGEYRHDFSDKNDETDSVSVHLSFGL